MACVLKRNNGCRSLININHEPLSQVVCLSADETAAAAFSSTNLLVHFFVLIATCRLIPAERNYSPHVVVVVIIVLHALRGLRQSDFVTHGNYTVRPASVLYGSSLVSRSHHCQPRSLICGELDWKAYSRDRHCNGSRLIGRSRSL